jgi:hypothetical protein
MKRFIPVILALFIIQGTSAQFYDPGIDSLISEVRIDSLMSYVRILSGEDSVYIKGEKEVITQRVYDSNDLAAEYLFEKLGSFGLNPVKLDYDTHGTNVVAYQTGTEFPNEFYFICAHYDGVTYYCADDNATGTATVLEAARILSDVEFPYSIAYALWDEEEIGLLGSRDYAREAKNMGMDIGGVINIDMIGWDSDDDGLVEIHSNFASTSAAIANVMDQINTEYDLGLDPVVHSPGASASDHKSFWEQGYGAILLIEGYWGNDFNPYYHSTDDRVDKFNVPYFHNAASMAIGSLAELATQNQYVSITNMESDISAMSISNYPNPFITHTTLSFHLPEQAVTRIDLVGPFGQLIGRVVDEELNAGDHAIQFDGSNLAAGIYSIVIHTPDAHSSHKMVVLE